MAKKKEEQGMSLDDAFADDEDVVYAESKPKKEKKKSKEEVDEEEEKEEEYEPLDLSDIEPVEIKNSKPIEKLKKGDKLKVDGKELEVDAHYLLEDHKTTKEMIIELFDKNEKDFQIRYFTGRIDVSPPEFYELVNEIIYEKRKMKKLEF